MVRRASPAIGCGVLAGNRHYVECIAGVPFDEMWGDFSGNGVYAMVDGGTVTLYIRGGSEWGPSTKGSAEVLLCTLPERLRPPITCGGSWVTPGAATYGVVNVYPDGRVTVSRSGGSDNIYYQACVSFTAGGARHEQG